MENSFFFAEIKDVHKKQEIVYTDWVRSTEVYEQL